MGIVPFKANEQAFEFVRPGKRALRRKPLPIHRFIEEPFATPFGPFPVARILWDIRDHAMIEARFPGFLRVKSGIRIEIGTCHD